MAKQASSFLRSSSTAASFGVGTSGSNTPVGEPTARTERRRSGRRKGCESSPCARRWPELTRGKSRESRSTHGPLLFGLHLGQKSVHLGPELRPGFPFRIRQVGQAVFVPQTGEVQVLFPQQQALLHGHAGLQPAGSFCHECTDVCERTDSRWRHANSERLRGG